MKQLLSLILIITLLSLPLISAQCINSADDYAVEVVLNKPGIGYDLAKLDNAKNVLISNNQYILKSDYSSSLAAILEKSSDLQCNSIPGLSVRLQIPIKSEDKTLPYLRFTSSAKGKLNISEDVYNGWKISCVQGNPIPQCEFKKEKTTISANLVGSKYDLTLETNENLKSCSSCDGICIGSSDRKCINKQLMADMEDMLKHSGLITSSLVELTASYRMFTTGNAIITDLSTEANQDINWGQALNKELLFLKSNNILFITNQDIEEISNLAKQGTSGTNSRIVYGEDKNNNQKWMYYSQTKFPALTKLQNCREFQLSSIPSGSLSFSRNLTISSYYLVPIILTVSLLVLFLILIVSARIIDFRKKKRLKPVTSLQS